MIRNFKRSAAVLGVVAAGSFALVACSDSSQLVGEGASSQQNAMDYFGQQYSEAVDGASLAYTASGSGSGRTNFIAGQADFAGSDSPLSDEQIGEAAERCEGNEAWHLPLVIGPVAIAYNLDGVDDLNLSIPTVAKIFNGEITNWNDDAIAEENDGVDLPDQNISVVYRSDESGTSDNFQIFLNTATPENWDTTGQQFPSAVGEGANGSNGVSTQVSQIPGGITYVEWGFAEQQELGVANLDFGSGPVELTAENVGVALDALEFETEGHNMVVSTDALFSQTQAGSYPLILTPYSIVCSAGYDEATSTMVKDFLNVTLDSQDENLEDMGFIPVEGAHADRLRAAADAIQ
ncbi:MAG TPA: phosphate ABC transporter substrate-binding protein PstS [Corynebacterium sp.]|nr:phosphate ABC transporter substrate-binding protein PstS [Corynebacterium sp.]